ncbi:hypothetical protein ACWDA3_32110 [Nonomuraea rubra]
MGGDRGGLVAQGVRNHRGPTSSSRRLASMRTSTVTWSPPVLNRVLHSCQARSRSLLTRHVRVRIEHHHLVALTSSGRFASA